MKKINKIILTFISVFIIALALPYSVSAAPIEDDQVIFGDSYTLESGRILDGNLVMIGGVIDIQESAIVRGDIVTVGSVGNINGTIEGNLVAIGGTVTLAENALIQGNVYSPNSFINQEEGAVVQGETINEWQFPLPNIYTPSFNLPGINRGTGLRFLPGINRIVNKLATTLLIVALGSLMLLIMPKPAEVMVNALNASPWQVLGYGALTALVMLVSSVVFSITICLIPVVILLALAFGFAVLAGWLTLGYELGKRIASSLFKTSWHPVLAAAIGNLVLYLVAIGLESIPCLGGFLVFVVALFGQGMSIVTLFGTKPFPKDVSTEKEGQIVLVGDNEEQKINETAQNDSLENEES